MNQYLAWLMPLNHTKCISLNNKRRIIQPTLINLHPNEYIQGSNYYLFAVNLGRSRGRSNTLIYPIDCMFKKKWKILI